MRAQDFGLRSAFLKPFVVCAVIALLSLALAGRGTAQNFTTLYNFSQADYGPNTDGDGPAAGLILANDVLYGTSSMGGTWGFGTVFAIGQGFGATNLHSFMGGTNEGSLPYAALVLSGNTLYGTTSDGGAFRSGTVFAINTDGSGFTNLHHFGYPVGSGYGTNSDGAAPHAGLVLSGNTLYGTAELGGNWGGGAIFAINTDGSGFTNLYSFTSNSFPVTNADGAFPGGALVLKNDTLYGTTLSGGTWGSGTVFGLKTNGSQFTNLYSFSPYSPYSSLFATNSDGALPISKLVVSGDALYGTALFGGTSGNGTVFALRTDGTGFTNLHNFSGPFVDGYTPPATNTEGAYIFAGLVLAGNMLYGTTVYGGSSGNGTLFGLSTNGMDFRVVHDFSGPNSHNYSAVTNIDGANPGATLIVSGNKLYGTAFGGGSEGGGTVYSISLTSTSPTISCAAPLILECRNGAAIGTVQVEAEDTTGYPLQAVWTVDGAVFQTNNNIPPQGNLTKSNVTFTASFSMGEHVVMVSVSNGQTDPVTCSTKVTVRDTTPPQIAHIAATPNVLWPPNHRMVPVNVMVEAVDNCDPSPVVRIISVTSNEPQNPLAADWEITGAQSLNLRAERLGKGTGRIYTIVVQCRDMSGNVSRASITVTVRHD